MGWNGGDGSVVPHSWNEQNKLTFHQPSSATGGGFETPRPFHRWQFACFLGDDNWIFERKVFEMDINWKKFMMAALIRAIRTFAQTFVSMVAVGAAFSEVEWVRVLSVSGVAFVLSVLTSFATGLPEAQ